MSLNLRDLLTKPRSELPDLVDSKYCIYKIQNQINGKVYIGQTVWLYGRFVIGPDWRTHLGSIRSSHSTHLYNSIRKYGSQNFEVSILEANLSGHDELNKREMYWIEYYNSYRTGYNQDKGGYDMTPCHSPESIRKKIESDKLNHGGVLAIHTSESIAKSIQTRTRIYGSPFGTINNQKVYERLKSERGGDYMAACHTEEARQKSLDTQRRNHGGALAFNTDEALKKSIATRIEWYGSANACVTTPEVRAKAVATEYDYYGCMKMHNEENHMKSTLTQLINSINKNLELFNNDPYAYYHGCNVRHWNRVISKLDLLKQDPRWTDLMTKIFILIDQEYKAK